MVEQDLFELSALAYSGAGPLAAAPSPLQRVSQSQATRRKQQAQGARTSHSRSLSGDWVG